MRSSIIQEGIAWLMASRRVVLASPVVAPEHASGLMPCVLECGCLHRIAADWPDPAVEDPNGVFVRLRHPIPGTIKAVEAENVCLLHRLWLEAPLPRDPYYGSPGYLGAIVPGRNQLRWPVDPTPAERLYMHFYRYTRQRFNPDTCTCAIASVRDRADAEFEQIVTNFHYSRRCFWHADEHGWLRAIQENQAKNRALMLIGTVAPRLVYSADEACAINVSLVKQVFNRPGRSLSDEAIYNALQKVGIRGVRHSDYVPGYEPTWRYDDQRVLHIDIAELTAGEQSLVRQMVSPSVRLAA